jgi:hypothetical protein
MEWKHKSVQGCFVDANLSVLKSVIIKNKKGGGGEYCADTAVPLHWVPKELEESTGVPIPLKMGSASVLSSWTKKVKNPGTKTHNSMPGYSMRLGTQISASCLEEAAH